MKKYDIIVIGAGGGAKIITPAAKMGYKVAAIEKESLGGTCLNRGCIPSKMLIYPADLATLIRESRKFDLNVDTDFEVHFEPLVSRISDTVDRDSASISVAYNKNPNIDFYHQEARFVANKVVDVNGETLTADKIFIAVGARPHIPKIPGLSGTPYMTSREALRNTKIPQRLLVIGAGYIAAELGHAYGALGSEVHFIVRSGLLRQEDPDIRTAFTQEFSKRYNTHIGSTPKAVCYANQEFSVTCTTRDGQEKQLEGDALLVVTGVVPNTDSLNLERTDIRLNEKGFVKVNDRLMTDVEGVYALGDCVGNYLFRHSVNFEGEYLMRTLFTEKTDEPIHYAPVPHAIFSYPEVAGVGKTETDLKSERVDYIVGTNLYKDSAMGMARLSDHGFVKVLFEYPSKKLLGAHIIGDEASNMIHLFVLGLTMGATLDDLLRMIYIHPALPEVARNAVRKAKVAYHQRMDEDL